MRGRKPLPTALKLLAGNPGHQRLPKGEPVPEPGIREPPEWLSAYALEVWHRDAPGLVNMGILGQSHWAVFALYCMAMGQVRAANEGMKEQAKLIGTESDGMLQQGKTDGAYTRSPLYNISVESGKMALRYAAELGMTPSAQTRLAIVPMSRPESKLSKLLYVEK